MGLIETATAILASRLTNKLLDRVVVRTEKNRFIIQTMKAIGLLEPKLKAEFESIYAHSLVKFVAEAYVEHKPFHRLFASKKVQSEFKSGNHLESQSNLKVTVNSILNSDKKYEELNSVDLEKALELFAAIYRDLTSKTATPYQIEEYYEDLRFKSEVLGNQDEIISEQQRQGIELAGVKEELRRKSFDYQIRQYLENQIIAPFHNDYLIPDKYVPLIGHQVQSTAFQRSRRIRNEKAHGIIRDFEIGLEADSEGSESDLKERPKFQKKSFSPIERFFQTVFNSNNPDRYHFVVMLGEYGTGKTTFFKFLAYSLAAHYLDNEITGTVHDPKQRIPILIPLREYNGEPFERFIVSHLSEYGVNDFDRGQLKAKLRNGEFILLLDGFDEMISREAETRKKYHAELLKDLLPAEGDAGSLVFLSSRKEYFQGIEERDQIFGIKNSDAKVKVEFLHLDTFSDQQIREFLEKNKEPGQDVNKLMEQINTIFDLKDLAKRAVLLELIIKYLPQLVKRRKNPDEPIRSVELYQEVFSKELERVRKKVFKGEAFLGSVKKQRELLRNLALYLHLPNELVFSYQEAETALCSLMNYGPEIQKRTIEGDLTKFLTFSFLLNDGESQYRFSHKSFRDFLVAEALYQEIQLGKIVDFGKRLNSDEVTTFLAELQPDPDKLRDLLNNSKGLAPGYEYQGSNALKTLLKLDLAALKNKMVFRAEIREVDFTKANLQGCTIGESILNDCTWDMNMFDLSLNETEVRGGGGYYWGKDYSKLDWNQQKERRKTYPSGREQFRDLANSVNFAGIEELDLSGTQVSDLGPLKDLQNLNSLVLRSTQVSDLGPLKDLQNLNSLVLRSTQVSDLGPLKDLQNLNSLVLRSTQVSDLGPLKDLQNLNSLDLAGTQVSDLGPLKDLQNLNSLNLISTQVSDLGPLKELQNLNSLDLSGTQVSDLGPLKELQNLNSLNLISTQVSDLGPLKELQNLNSLNLISTQVSDFGPLKELQNLNSLNLYNTQVSDLGPLKELQNLNSLNLYNTQVSDLGPLKELQNLNSLDLAGTQVSDLGPLKDLQNLNSLDLSGTQVSDLGPLKDLQNLNSLDLAGTQVSDLGPLKDLQNLNSLDLAGTQVSDLGPLKELQNLKKITLSEKQLKEDIWQSFSKDRPDIELKNPYF